MVISEETSVFESTDDEERVEVVSSEDPVDGAIVVVFVVTSPVSWAFFNASFMEIVGSFLESRDSGERGREEGAVATVPFISSVCLRVFPIMLRADATSIVYVMEEDRD